MKLFDWFLSRPEKHQMVLGISLTDDMIRWVRLVRRSDNGFMSIEGHGYSPLAQDIVVHGSIQKPNELLRALLPLRVHAELPVAVALPIEATQVFKLSIILEPGIDPEKTIQEEIIAYIGRETTLVSADTLCEYEIIHASSTHAYIFGTLYPRSQVDAYKAIFERIGFKKSETLSIPASLARMHTDDQQHAYIIIDIGISVTHIALVLGTTVSLLQTIPVGEASLLNTIQSYLQVNDAEARKIYKRYGLMHTHREPELLVALHNTLNPVKKSIEEVLESWQGIYKHQVENSPVVEMVVLGDGAYGKGVLEYLRRISTLETRHLNVWRLFPEVHNVVPEIDWYDALRFAPAIAVALENIRKNV